MKPFFYLILTLNCILVFLSACESHEQKADEAFDRVKEEKRVEMNNPVKSIDSVPPVEKIKIKSTNKNLDEWMQFKNEMEKVIAKNEIKIKEIRKQSNSNAKTFRKLAGLEKDNNDLLKQMNEYQIEIESRWKNFKIQLTNDQLKINGALEDLTDTRKI